MTITLNGTTGISSPGGDTATVSLATPLISSPSSLTLQTNGSTTAVTIDTSQNVNIGATSSATGSKLYITSGTATAIGWNGNNGATYPTTNFGGAIGNNFSNGGCEADIWNTYVGAPYSFDFYQKTGTSAANNLLRIMPNGTLCLLGAGSVTSGTGITFPATQSASSDANTLDDYEEGTFTPVMQFGGASAFSSGTANGKYTKVGNIVTFEILFGSYTKTANTGVAAITGLPFTFSDLGKIWMAQGDSLTYTSGAFLFSYNDGTGTTIYPYQQAAGTATQFTNASFNNGGSYRVSGIYMAAT